MLSEEKRIKIYKRLKEIYDNAPCNVINNNDFLEINILFVDTWVKIKLVIEENKIKRRVQNVFSDLINNAIKGIVKECLK